MNVLKQLHQEHDAINTILDDIEEAAFWSKWIAAAKRFGRGNVRLVAAPQRSAADEARIVQAMRQVLEQQMRDEQTQVWRQVRRHFPAPKRARLDSKYLPAAGQPAKAPARRPTMVSARHA
jgi:hypothetical protein